jgi:hypothetical protein
MTDIVSERIQSLSEKEFALGGPMDIGTRMSEDIIVVMYARRFVNTAN